MKFSKKTVYGLRAMTSLAKNKNKESIPLSEIAKHEGISKKYLEQLFSKLKKAGMVVSEKGVKGGYKLSQKPEKISIFEIVKALGEPMSPTGCLSETGKVACFGKNKCGAVFVLGRVQKAANDVLRKTTLKELIK